MNGLIRRLMGVRQRVPSSPEPSGRYNVALYS